MRRLLWLFADRASAVTPLALMNSSSFVMRNKVREEDFTVKHFIAGRSKVSPPVLHAGDCASTILRMALKDQVRRAREAKGYSQDGLARLSGVSLKQIQNIESGANTSLETVVKLADTLGLSEIDAGSFRIKTSGAEMEFGEALRMYDPKPRFRRMRVEAYVAAGYGGWDDHTGDEWLDVPEFLVGPNDFVVEAKGESLIDENIEDGDRILVTRVAPNMAPTGSLVVAWLNDGLVIKFWARRGGRKVLFSRNPEWPEREITPDDVFEIQAVVKQILKSPKNKAAELAREVKKLPR